MSDDFWPDPNSNRSIEHSGESSSEGGGHRFVFYGSPGAPGRKKAQDKKSKLVGQPVELELSGDTLAEDIVEVHTEESVRKKVEELGEKIKDDESRDEKSNGGELEDEP